MASDPCSAANAQGGATTPSLLRYRTASPLPKETAAPRMTNAAINMAPP